MKRKTLVLLVLFFSLTNLLAQDSPKNTMYVVGAPAISWYDYKGSIDGGASFSSKMAYTIGLEYSRELFKNFELLSGLHYSSSKMSTKSSSSLGPAVPITKRTFHINYIAVPIQAKYHFSKYFFANAGTIIKFRVSDKEHNDSDTFGLLMGLGANFDFKEKYCLIVNPYFQMNHLSSDRLFNFHNLGLKVGLGYKF